jgi:two-component system KDP operon response regulator KdpE
MAARVLVVDDEPQMRRALNAGLRGNGFDVLLASSGEEALDRAALELPDIVLLDLALPDIDGLDVVRQLRAWSNVPIVVVSARGEERDKIAALDIGADDYLTKPFGIGELLARLRVALRHAERAAGRSEPVIHDGDLTVDFGRRVVMRSGEEIHLTPTEYDLLGELITHAGKVLTHQMLLTRVWGPAAVNDTQYLRTYVNQLRKKIEDDPARPTRIITEPGIGYRYRLPGGHDT